MKQRTISIMLILFLTVTLLAPMGARPAESYGAGSFSVRTSVPGSSDPNAKYYYSDLNRFWKAGRLAPDFKYYEKIMDDGRTGGYVWGNCTWWAYSRASEVLGEPLNPNLRGNAGEWWDCNKKGGFYPYGSEPKAGAIVVYATHVAFVEQIVNGQVYVSESGWQTKTEPMSTYDDIYFHYGIPWHNKETPKGYIYVTDKAPVNNISSTPVNYNVQVSVDQLRMRSGPGTGYANMGYIKPGVHQLKAITTDGEWGQLASNGYWIFMEYAEKVVTTAKSKNNKLKSLSVSGYAISPAFKAATTSYSLTVPGNVSSVTINAVKSSKKASLSGTGAVTLAAGNNVKTITVTAENGAARVYTLNITRKQKVNAKAVNYKVKVTVTDLNMRGGPGKNYKSKGTLKKGTYTIIQTKNGWGKLKKNGYWIKLEYTKKVTKKTVKQPARTKNFKVKVKVKDLNMRGGPGKKYKSKGKLKKGTYKIVKTKNGWGKLKKNGYWIKLSHTKRV